MLQDAARLSRVTIYPNDQLLGGSAALSIGEFPFFPSSPLSAAQPKNGRSLLKFSSGLADEMTVVAPWAEALVAAFAEETGASWTRKLGWNHERIAMPTRILIVDDSEVIRMTVAHAFEPFDCEVVEAANGAQGLALARQTKPDIILLDVSMPVMDGTEMLRRAKLESDLHTIPVIMLTAEAARDTVLRVAKIGVRDYLIKPFNEDQIVERVRRLVELQPRPAAKTKRVYHDPWTILVVDDKPAIHDQIVRALADTPWQVEGESGVPAAWERIKRQPPDALMVSTSLPSRAGFWLLETVHKNPRTSQTPIFALSVKTAVEDHLLAQRLGATSVITKPIDLPGLKAKIARALGVNLPCKYVHLQPEALILDFPFDSDDGIDPAFAPCLESKLAEAVDAGIGRVVMNLSGVNTITVPGLQFLVGIQQSARQLSMKIGFIVSPAARSACGNYEETGEWVFGDSLASVLASLDLPTTEAAQYSA
jgi:DNA-binding response OmpR family regulator